MSTYAQLAHDNRNKAITDLRSILDAAADEGRDLSPEEVEQVERAEQDAEKYGHEAERAQRADELAAQAADFRAPEVRVETPEKQDAPTEGDLFKRGFEAVRDGGGFVIDELDGPAPRATFYRALGDAAAGGTAVPTSFREKVIWYLRDNAPMLDPRIVTVLETPTGNPIDLPQITADPTHGGTVTAEAAGVLEADPTIAKTTLGAYKYGITTLWSAELGQDEVIGLDDIIAKSAARELSIDINAHLTTGTGSGQPLGIVPACAASVVAGGTADGTSFDTFFAPADLLDLMYGLNASYRMAPGAAFMVSTTALAKMRKARNADGGFMWDMSLVAGQPDRFNGKPVYENASMAAVASASSSVVFGDLKSYYVRRTPIRVEFSKDYKFNTDQLALRTIFRVDGDLPDTTAIKDLVSADT